MTTPGPIIGVTGAAGFLGWHLRCRIKLIGAQPLSADRSTFTDQEQLDDFVQRSDLIIHAAGVNRARPEEVEAGNPALATALVEALERTGAAAPLLYTNSTHAAGDSIYGRSKRAAADILSAHQRQADMPFVDAVLPHLFGEFGRPDYNSAVSTFAFDLANQRTPSVNRDGSLELAHAQDVAAHLLDLVTNAKGIETDRFQGSHITVGEVWDIMANQHRRYTDDGTVPAFENQLELRLFNTLRSHLYSAGHYPVALVAHRDQRGAFIELARADGLGQTSLSTSAPGVVRGDHFHLDKIERFIVVDGTARITMRRVLTDEVVVADVSGDDPCFIDMPPLVTHKIENIGTGQLTTMFWAGDHFDPAVPDTWPELVGAS